MNTHCQTDAVTVVQDEQSAGGPFHGLSRFETLCENAVDAIICFDLMGRFTYVNPAAAQLVGYSRTELSELTLFDIVTPELASHAVATLKSAHRGRFPRLSEWETVTKDGTRKHVEFTGQVVRSTNGIVEVQAIVRDITARRMAEQQIRKLSRAVECTSSSVVITDREGRIEYVNPKFVEVTGYTANEVKGLNPRVLKSGEQSIEFYKDLWETITSGCEWKGEFRNKKKNGELYWESASISPIKDSAGRITHFIAVKEDITERKLAEEKLRASERSYRHLFERNVAGVFRTTTEGIIVDANDAWFRIFGYDRAALRHLNARELYVFPDDRERMLARLRREGTISNFELRHRRRDGSTGYLLLNVNLVERGNRKGQYIEGTLIDITDRKRMERELRAALEVAEAASKSKGEFLANMSHEIRTPMNGIIGMTELALDTDLTAEQRDYLSTVKSCADSLLTLINDILDFSKIEAGQLNFEEIEFDVRSAFTDALKPLVLRAGSKKVALTFETAPDVPDRVVGDPTRLRQVLVNIVNNAVKFTDQGSILVQLRLDPSAAGEATLHVSVQDTGIGIPKDKRQLIFEAFSQADSSITRRFGGTGLGLAISANLVSCMRGRIWVESENAKGSTFHFTATVGMLQPRKAEECLVSNLQGPTTGAPDATSSPDNVRGLRFLLAEDNKVNQRLMTRLLEKGGHSIVTVEDGQEALDRWQGAAPGEFDVVLLDVQMPKVDGLEVARRIRKNERAQGTPRIPLIALTAHAMKGDQERCIAAGMDAYVTKPIAADLLFAAIRSVSDASGRP